MTTFAVTDSSQVLEALNYVLSNLGQGGNSTVSGNVLTVNTTTGVISVGGSTTVQSYYYQYINVRYADDASGGGISTSPTNKTYYGVLNSSVASPTNINNPASYQWTAATGGFGTTKFLFYSTLGGRQIQFRVATTTPNSSFAQTTDGVTINLDFVTATSTLPVIVLNSYIRSATAPATPTGGSYNFTTLILTPPTGWSASVPTSGTNPVYVSTNTFTSPPFGGSAGPSDVWTTPSVFGKNGDPGATGPVGASGAVGASGIAGASGVNGVSTYFYNVFLSANTAPAVPSGGYYNFGTATGTPPAGWSNTATSPLGDPIWAVSAQVSSTSPTANVSIGSSWSSTFQYTGAGGAPGTRGFVPMAYVLTPLTPVGATNTNLSQWFQAATNGTPPGSNTAPVGTGYVPVSGDTAAFTFASNTAQVVVYTYSSTTSAWTVADGQVVNGNVLVTGSINSSRLNSNDVYTIKLQSTNANIGNNSSNGFWFDSTTGNARIAGNTSIGSNLTIGNNLVVANNASIGGNLAIAGLVLTGNLIANTVYSGAIQDGAVVFGKLAANSIQANAIQANTISGNIILANTLVGNSIIANTLYGNAIIANTLTASSINANAISAGTLNTGVLYAGNITSFGATQGNISSPGYWLNYTSGNARFGGNVWIGANLNVTGLITTGALQSNTVITNNIVNQSISQSGGIANAVLSTYATSPASGVEYYVLDTILGLTTTETNQATYVWGSLQNTVNYTGLAIGEYFSFETYLFLLDSVGTIIDQISYESYTIGYTATGTVTVTVQFNGFTYTIPVPGTYYWVIAAAWYPGSGTYSVNSFQAGPRSLLLQTIKR